ncbi:MAG: 50S ribosomal protein L24 [Candidatus Thorarchaeota archaeon]|nr:50S ribosomal protein L24 [Candidatus Thorarchaeota archaeon]
MVKKVSSKSPRKQRRLIYKSPLHTHKKMLKCRLDEFLREEYAMRSLVPKKGDLVRIMRGQFRDTEGKIVGIDYGKIRIYVDSSTTTKADGKEVQIPMHPSNLMLVKLELDDDRKEILQRKTVHIAESE